jgi:hypothetical protein
MTLDIVASGMEGVLSRAPPRGDDVAGDDAAHDMDLLGEPGPGFAPY